MKDELIAQFTSILSNATADDARFALEACNWDLETAIAIFMENPALSSSSMSNKSVSKRKSLFGNKIDDDDDNDYDDNEDDDYNGNGRTSNSRKINTRNTNKRVLPFSTFSSSSSSSSTQSETKSSKKSNNSVAEQENLNAYQDEDYVRPPIPSTTEVLIDEPDPLSMPLSFQQKRTAFVQNGKSLIDVLSDGVRHCFPEKKLFDLYAPPRRLLFSGNFQQAREEANAFEKWLIVQVMPSVDFSSFGFNIIWKSPEVEEFVKKHFILWQVPEQSSPGQEYIKYYPVAAYPYVVIIDPRTGQLVERIGSCAKSSEFIDKAKTFLSQNSLTNDSTTSATQSLEYSEEEILKRAIQASLETKQSSVTTKKNTSNVIDDDDDDDNVNANVNKVKNETKNGGVVGKKSQTTSSVQKPSQSTKEPTKTTTKTQKKPAVKPQKRRIESDDDDDSDSSSDSFKFASDLDESEDDDYEAGEEEEEDDDDEVEAGEVDTEESDNDYCVKPTRSVKDSKTSNNPTNNTTNGIPLKSRSPSSSSSFVTPKRSIGQQDQQSVITIDSEKKIPQVLPINSNSSGHSNKKRIVTLSDNDDDANDDDDEEVKRINSKPAIEQMQKTQQKQQQQPITVIPEPPAEEAANLVTRIAIRLPDGSRVMRRFYKTNLVSELFNFAQSQSVELQNGEPFEIMLHREKLSGLKDKTLEEAKVLGSSLTVSTL